MFTFKVCTHRNVKAKAGMLCCADVGQTTNLSAGFIHQALRLVGD
jgi:hypothetical protein